MFRKSLQVTILLSLADIVNFYILTLKFSLLELGIVYEDSGIWS